MLLGPGYPYWTEKQERQLSAVEKAIWESRGGDGDIEVMETLVDSWISLTGQKIAAVQRMLTSSKEVKKV